MCGGVPPPPHRPPALAPQVPAATMTDGESREPLPRPAGGEVRVPITAPPRRPAEQQQPEEEEEEDAGSGPVGSPCRDPPPDLASEEEEQVPYPALAPTAFFCLKQTTRPRSWCLRLVCNPYPFPEGHRTPPTPPQPPPGSPPRARSIPSGMRVPGAHGSRQHTGVARSLRGPPECVCVCPQLCAVLREGDAGLCRSGMSRERIPPPRPGVHPTEDTHTPKSPRFHQHPSDRPVREREGRGGRTSCPSLASQGGGGC